LASKVGAGYDIVWEIVTSFPDSALGELPENRIFATLKAFYRMKKSREREPMSSIH